MGRIKRSIGMALAAGAVLASATACGGHAAASTADAKSSPKASAKAGTTAGASASPSPTRPSGPPLLLDTITPESGSTVGVAMPISVEFTHAVSSSARAAIERHLKVTTSVPVTGAWHWFSDTRVDWRPEKFWPSGTRVTLNADLDGVTDGNGRYGTRSYQHSFTIGSDFETTVSVPDHTMKVTRNGSVVRTMAIDAGSPDFPSWDGTMAVMDKQREVRMTSCSVGITCDKGNPNFYDLTLPWDVQLTTSGTYVHYSTGDPYPGHSYGSHGCVHLSLSDAEWFYNNVEPGDPVTISGSPRGNVAGDNGYADFNVSWSQWLADSATGRQTTSAS
ncbi:L,D-transpeptidase [Streptantibioticus ferralitis]|uniref:Ig-like domain-containing protein n=1 Tax=Streptantibioticus ferralitis TaxID=236510 RepID=A0ABT5Z3X7_9ACTN|nr:L,D-transpeptidase [Streptantibioticus ferralitis]MDF2258536.1 Ig-like domain-containing protein [Streptantibioticus ferralitis]